MNDFKIIEHTADVGIRVSSKTLENLFENCVYGMYKIIFNSPPELKKEKTVYTVNIKTSDLEELLVKWLNELLFRLYTKRKMLVKCSVKKINETGTAPSGFSFSLEALCSETEVNKNNLKLMKEIKSATYHGLKIRNDFNNWNAEIIFDI